MKFMKPDAMAGPAFTISLDMATLGKENLINSTGTGLGGTKAN